MIKKILEANQFSLKKKNKTRIISVWMDLWIIAQDKKYKEIDLVNIIIKINEARYIGEKIRQKNMKLFKKLKSQLKFILNIL